MKKTCKKILSLVLCLTMVISMAAVMGVVGFADDDTVYTTADGNFSYRAYQDVTEYDDDNNPVSWVNTIEIVKYLGTDTEVTVPDSIPGLDNYAVLVLGSEAFANNADVTAVTLPDSLKVIDDRAFINCTALADVTMPDSVETIAGYAFYGCSALTFLHLPESLKYIGDCAFQNCAALTGNGYLPSTVPNVDGEYDNIPSLIIPAGVTYLGSNAFENCAALIRVVLPEGLREVLTGTFTGCAALERVEIPASVVYIGSAFNGAFKSHSNVSETNPVLIIKSPHCTIEDSPEIDIHVVWYGLEHYAVDAYVTDLNERRFQALYGDESHLIQNRQDLYQIKFVPLTDYTPVGHELRSEVTEPTCTTVGYTTYFCTCEEFADQKFVVDYVAALGHALGDPSIVPATCTDIGVITRTCGRCGYVSRTQQPALGHDWQPYISVTDTCNEDGITYDLCSRCGAKQNYKKFYHTGHLYDYANGEVVQEWEECATDGITIYTCTACGDQITETKPAHPDANNDYYCDVCEEYIGTSDLTPDKTCTCSCHSQLRITAFFYKIKLFVWKLFKVNKVCECGVAHY